MAFSVRAIPWRGKAGDSELGALVSSPFPISRASGSVIRDMVDSLTTLGKGYRGNGSSQGVTVSASMLVASIAKGYCAHCGAQDAASLPCLITKGSHDWLYYEGDVFCERCGERAGKESTCISVDGAHDFKDYASVVYCERCGVRAGSRSECIAVSREHSFRRYPGRALCKFCQVPAGNQTICAKTKAEHAFVRL